MRLQWCKENIHFIFIDTESLVVSIKMDGFFENIKDYFEERYVTSNYVEGRRNRSLPVGRKQNKVIGLMKDEKIYSNYTENMLIKHKKMIRK